MFGLNEFYNQCEAGEKIEEQLDLHHHRNPPAFHAR